MLAGLHPLTSPYVHVQVLRANEAAGRALTSPYVPLRPLTYRYSEQTRQLTALKASLEAGGAADAALAEQLRRATEEAEALREQAYIPLRCEGV